MSDRREKLDAFESVFRSADKARFEFEPTPLARGVLVTAFDEARSGTMLGAIRSYLNSIQTPGADGAMEWEAVHWGADGTIRDLKSTLESISPDLVALHRNVGDPADSIVHSLGVVMDELTQWSPYPVLALPGRDRIPSEPAASIMVLTDRLAANNRLVSIGAQFASPAGRLHLVDIEDGNTFERYIEIIERIPDINTDLAREKILEKLLHESRTYIGSCESTLAKTMPGVRVGSEVVIGHHVNDVRRLLNSHAVDLVVLNTHDEAQVAMHGMAYAIAVEFRDIPLLMC